MSGALMRRDSVILHNGKRKEDVSCLCHLTCSNAIMTDAKMEEIMAFKVFVEDRMNELAELDDDPEFLNETLNDFISQVETGLEEIEGFRCVGLICVHCQFLCLSDLLSSETLTSYFNLRELLTLLEPEGDHDLMPISPAAIVPPLCLY